MTGTPQEVTAADGTLVWAGYIRGLERMRRTSATAGVLSPAAAAAGAVF
ncbi:hypothetical protein JT306_12575 [Salmonella enterica subsp. enterica serovar Kentucky]|nr:hypothetical protein [Salmonella enterica subsp. enterica serovar Kentucky]